MIINVRNRWPCTIRITRDQWQVFTSFYVMGMWHKTGVEAYGKSAIIILDDVVDWWGLWPAPAPIFVCPFCRQQNPLFYSDNRLKSSSGKCLSSRVLWLQKPEYSHHEFIRKRQCHFFAAKIDVRFGVNSSRCSPRVHSHPVSSASERNQLIQLTRC